MRISGKRVIIPGLMLLLVVISGCGETKGAVYGASDCEIRVSAGETFTIQLDENPTTGYAWTVAFADNIVVLTEDEYTPPKTDAQLVGSGGQRALTFKGIQKGDTTITLNYERSFEENSSVKTLVFQVTVE